MIIERKHQEVKSEPKVSVIMPSLNVGDYIQECIESVINQTLKEIEIICIDAGSTDGTLEVLEEYAKKDNRIRIINSEQKSYGYQMNLGLDAASGEYVGIVETDDWIDQEMFEILWKIAHENNVDVVKSNYYWYITKPSIQNKLFENLSRCTYNKVFCPLNERTIFTTTPAIWSGIYRRQLLLNEKIRFNETPGASYQDTSFHFMVCTVASTFYLIEKAFLHYRRDNEKSSVNSAGKINCVSDEMHYYERFLSKNLTIQQQMKPFYMALKYEKYRWNYSRLAPELQWRFLELFYNEFLEALTNGDLVENQFAKSDWENMQLILKNPIRYFEKTCKIYSTRPLLSEVYPYKILRQARNNDPKVSVIIPAYNYEKYIGESIESVLNQTMKEFEIICVNDGSIDKTLEIILDYADRDERITVISQVNKGQSSARNVAMSIAKGRYIHFLDSDDLMKKNAYNNLLTIAFERNLDVLYFDGEAFFESPKLESQYPHYKTAYEYNAEIPDCLSGVELFCRMKRDGKYRVSPCLAIYRKDYLIENDLKFIEGIFHEDSPFSFKCMISARRVAHLKKKYFLRRVHFGSTMTIQKSFLHLYGYLVGLIDIQNFALTLPYSSDLYLCVRNELNSLVNLLRRTYVELQDKNKCRTKLNQVELFYLDKVVNESDSIRASTSYKIGRLITFIPRKIRGGFRCYKEHGFYYTIHRVLAHLHLV